MLSSLSLTASRHLSAWVVPSLKLFGAAAHSTLAATAAQSGTHQWQHVTASPPGSTLCIAARGRTHIHVNPSSDHTAETLQLTSDVSSWAVHSSSSAQGAITVDVQQSQAATTSNGSSATIAALVPIKWTTLNLATEGGQVHVGRVQEAGLRVDSGGGQVVLGTVRAVDVKISTLCATGTSGDVQASELSANTIDLQVRGKCVDLKRLLGRHIVVSARRIHVGALFADDVLLQAAGDGPVHVGTMDCNGHAQLTAAGGGISVGALDGNAEVTSGGGTIEVHVHERVGTVRLDSGGGNVLLAVSDTVMASVVVHNARRVDAGAGISGTASGREWSAQLSAAPSDGRRMLSSPAGQIVVDAGGTGVVSVRRLSWMEAVQARMSSRRQSAAAEAQGVAASA